MIDKQALRDYTAEQIEILQVIYDEIAATWVMDDAEITKLTIAIYKNWL